MRSLLALSLILSMTLLAGCGADKPADTSQNQGSTQAAEKPAEAVGEPVTITPDPGELGSKDLAGASPVTLIDATDGVDETEAQIVGSQYLRALRAERLGADYGKTAEAFTLLNTSKLMGEVLLTYSRTTVDGAAADAYAATIVLNEKTGEQVRVTEAP